MHVTQDLKVIGKINGRPEISLANCIVKSLTLKNFQELSVIVKDKVYENL